MKIFDLKEGVSPLVISNPHAGTYVPPDIVVRLTDIAKTLRDTDWHIPLLYDFDMLEDTTIISARYSRYVVDLNRPPDNATLYPGQAKLGLCPDTTFDGEALYKQGKAPDDTEIQERRATYWQPYHDALAAQVARVKSIHGYAILYDAHSIKAVVPRLFDGHLPDLNLGTANGRSCAPALEAAAFNIMQHSPYSAVANGRFIGGYITRHYGDPRNNVHALQMEIARDNYMEEEGFSFNPDRAKKLRTVLYDILDAIQMAAKSPQIPLRTTPTQGL